MKWLLFVLWGAIEILAAFALITGAPATAFASTYVGNGGNSGDVEWLVTLKQIQSATDLVDSDPDLKLCTCDDTYSNSSVCDALDSLTPPQRAFCAVTLRKQLPFLQTLVRDDRTVRVSWTRDNIEVLEGGNRRAVDAVTDRTRGTVTLNAEQFRHLNPSERVFLISHELFHLTMLDGRPMVDDGEVGPFKDERALINSMAASLTIQTNQAGSFDRFKATLNRPQGWRENWLDLSFAKLTATSQSTYGVTSYNAVRGRFTHFFPGNIGLNGGFISLKGDQQTLGTIKSTETSQTWQVGASYRIFPFKDPLTMLGQSHLVLSADVDFNKGEFNLKSTYTDDTVRSSKVGGSAEIRYNFPVLAGLWFSILEAYETLPAAYTFQSPQMPVQISTDANDFATYVGVSYAF